MAYRKIKKDGNPAVKSGQHKMPNFEEFIKIANSYLDICDKEKRIPLIGKLALLCGVDTDTIGKYRYKSPYGGVIKRIDQMCENGLLDKGLNENKPVFPMFLLKSKYGYVEEQYKKIDVIHSGNIGIVQMPKKRLN